MAGKMKKFLVGLGLTTVVGGGLTACTSSKNNNQDNEKMNTEWKARHLDADSIVADAAHSHFFAQKNPDTLAIDSLKEQKEKIRNKAYELQKAKKVLLDKSLHQLWDTADKKDAKKYLAIQNALLKDNIRIDYDKEDEKGISLNDRLEANADLGDARWVSINRRKPNIDDEIIVNDMNRPEMMVSVLEKRNDGWWIAGVEKYDGAALENRVLFPEDKREKFVFNDFLKQAPAKTMMGIQHQMEIAFGVFYMLDGEMRQKEGYTKEASGEDVDDSFKKALLKSYQKRQEQSK